MNTLPVPHPESAEILARRQAVDYVSLGNVILDAAAGEGFAPNIPGESTYDYAHYPVHDYSEKPALTNGYGVPVRNAHAEAVKYAETVKTSNGGTATAESEERHIDQVYPYQVSRTVTWQNPDSSTRETVVLNEARDGQWLDQAPTIIKPGQDVRGVTPEEEGDIKYRIANDFDLKYTAIPHPLDVKEGTRIRVSSETMDKVDSMVMELAGAGLSGDQLRVELLRQLHPDTNDSDAETQEAFQYAAALDYSRSPIHIKHERNPEGSKKKTTTFNRAA